MPSSLRHGLQAAPCEPAARAHLHQRLVRPCKAFDNSLSEAPCLEAEASSFAYVGLGAATPAHVAGTTTNIQREMAARLRATTTSTLATMLPPVNKWRPHGSVNVERLGHPDDFANGFEESMPECTTNPASGSHALPSNTLFVHLTWRVLQTRHHEANRVLERPCRPRGVRSTCRTCANQGARHRRP